MSGRTVSHWVSVNASMFAVAPPRREPVPDAPTPPNGAYGLVGDGLLVDVDDARRIRSASAIAAPTSPRMPTDSPYSLSVDERDGLLRAWRSR